MIAYRQPVTRARVSAIRGVNVDGVVRTLLARGLIAEVGTDPETGGGLFRTTDAVPGDGWACSRWTSCRRWRRCCRSWPASNTTNSEVEVETLNARTTRASGCRRCWPPPGVGSRRACEELIAAGRVSVDGVPVAELGHAGRPGRRRSSTSTATRVNVRDDLVYLALNKPRGRAHARCRDDRGRPTRRRPGRRPRRAAVPRRPARRRHRGPAAADQRRRARAPADASVASGCSKTYLADGAGAGRPRRSAGGCGPASSSTTARCAVDAFRVVQTSRRPGDRRGRAARGPQAHRAAAAGRRSGTRCTRLVRTAIGPVRLGGQRPGTLRELTARRARRAASSSRQTGCARAIGSRRDGTDGTERHGGPGDPGAIQVDANERDADPRRRLRAGHARCCSATSSTRDDLISIVFTATPDLTAEFPALRRAADWA